MGTLLSGIAGVVVAIIVVKKIKGKERKNKVSEK
jgi:hypothetical protein